MPRTAGGAINPHKAAESYYAAKNERDEGSKCLYLMYYII